MASDYSNQNVVLLPQKYGNLLKANTSPNFETIDRKKYDISSSCVYLGYHKVSRRLTTKQTIVYKSPMRCTLYSFNPSVKRSAVRSRIRSQNNLIMALKVISTSIFGCFYQLVFKAK